MTDSLGHEAAKTTREKGRGFTQSDRSSSDRSSDSPVHSDPFMSGYFESSFRSPFTPEGRGHFIFNRDTLIINRSNTSYGRFGR